MDPTIRHAEVNDYLSIHRIYSQPKVAYGTLQVPFSSSEVSRKRLMEADDGSYSLVACVDEEVVGHLHLQTNPNKPRRSHAGRIGMAVSDEWQGKGIGNALMEAVIHFAENWLNLIRLELTVFIDNDPAIQLYKKYGFEIEGTLKGYAFRDGKFVDVYTMARMRG